MDFQDYQTACRKTAIYPNQGNNLIYPVLGLVGESGEVAEAVKKLIRDQKNELTDEYRLRIAREMGDVLWYLSALSDELGIPLAEIADINIKKLQARQEQNKLKGDGSDR